jgi:hypothetical protein
MCVKCFITDAASAGDWDEVARLAREQKKTEKAEEKGRRRCRHRRRRQGRQAHQQGRRQVAAPETNRGTHPIHGGTTIVSTLAQFLRRRALALVVVLAALGIVVGGAVALNPAPQPRPDATCGYVFHISRSSG